MKKNIFTCSFVIAALLFSIDVSAQKMGDAAERSAKLTEWMRINLNLTDEQLPCGTLILSTQKNGCAKNQFLPKSEKMKQIKTMIKQKIKN